MRQITGSEKLEQASIKQKMIIVNSPLGWIRGARAMAEHQSQLVWFRYLYFAASRLVWHNELEELLEHG
jgi:N-acetylglucosaminylphosphatidylinositol deacetylase